MKKGQSLLDNLIVLRIPLITDVTDRGEILKGLAAFRVSREEKEAVLLDYSNKA